MLDALFAEKDGLNSAQEIAAPNRSRRQEIDGRVRDREARLVETEVVVAALRHALGVMCRRFQKIAGVTPRIRGLTADAEIECHLNAEIRAALDECSDPRFGLKGCRTPKPERH